MNIDRVVILVAALLVIVASLAYLGVIHIR